MNLRIGVILLIASVLTPGLGEAAPKASTSEYLKTTAAGINIAGGKEPLFYSLILSVRKELDAPLYVRSSFERPGEPDKPLIVESKIDPGDGSVFVESPQFQGIKNDETYSVTILLFEDSERTNEISRHNQDIHFKVPSKFFEKLGLKKP